MAFTSFVTLYGTNNVSISFDFVTYIYRAYATTASGTGTVTLAVTESGYNRGVYKFTPGVYTPLYEGMGNANDTTLPSGTNLFSLIGISSDTILIERDFAWTPPNLKANINGTIKEFDKGWVNIDGQLKEIDKMWTRIDDVLREV